MPHGDIVLKLTPDELQAAKKMPKVFIAGWLVFGFLMAVARAYTVGNPYLMVLTFCMECSTTPVLGCVLFALALECTFAKKEVILAKDAISTQTLDCESYKLTASNVQKRSEFWTTTLFLLASVALYCTVGLVMSQRFMYGKTGVFHTGDDDIVSTVELDIIIATELMKEAMVLFMMMQLVLEVNVEADSIISALLAKAWGEASSAREVTRAHLLFLATTEEQHSDGEATTWWNYFTRQKSVGRISFYLLGVRISRELFVGLFSSLILGIVHSLSKELSEDAI